ncbi:TIGR02646 family protein, partial [Escherichia coli]|nr:TIGR02646 family protein [Escherichia coli]
NPQRTFDYNNLAACALDSQSDLEVLKIQGAEVFGGHASGKSKGVDMARFVSCHMPDCSRFFAYLSDGRVVPADGLSPEEVDRAEYTI